MIEGSTLVQSLVDFVYSYPVGTFHKALQSSIVLLLVRSSHSTTSESPALLAAPAAEVMYVPPVATVDASRGALTFRFSLKPHWKVGARVEVRVNNVNSMHGTVLAVLGMLWSKNEEH